MTESFEYKGFFFLPGDENNAVAGTVNFVAGEKIELELIGTLRKEDDNSLVSFLKQRDKPIEIIHGISSDAKKITLLNCSAPYGSQNLSLSFGIQKFQCQFLLTGSFIYDIEEKCFDKAYVEITSLYDWLCINAIEFSIEFNEKEKIKRVNYTITNEDQSERRLIHSTQVDSSLTIQLRTSVRIKTSFEVEDIALVPYGYVEFLSHTKNNILDFLTYFNSFVSFLSLATLNNCYFTEINLRDSSKFQDFGNGIKYYDSIKLHQINKIIKRKEKFKPFNFLFSFQDIKDVFSDIIKKWFNEKIDIIPIRNYLIESLENKELFKSTDFLILVQALEGYHRRFINKEKIALKKRIEELLIKFSDIDAIKMLNIDIDATVDSRDYYSHFFNRNEKNKIIEGRELYELSQKLRVLLICVVLNFIGLKNNQINELLNKSNNSIVKNYERRITKITR